MELAGILPRSGVRSEPDASRELWERMDEIQSALDSLESCFNMTADSGLIDSLCYQIKALRVEYSRLLREAKRCGCRRAPFI